MCKMETGGHVSENLTLVTSPVTGVDRKLLGNPRMFWAILGKALEAGTGSWEPCNPQQWTLLHPVGGTRAAGVDGGDSHPTDMQGCFAFSRRNQVLGPIGEEGLDS